MRFYNCIFEVKWDGTLPYCVLIAAQDVPEGCEWFVKYGTGYRFRYPDMVVYHVDPNKVLSSFALYCVFVFVSTNPFFIALLLLSWSDQDSLMILRKQKHYEMRIPYFADI